ncbi:Zn-dependent protease with chaperone function [Psychrobacter luti]|uniref:Zn-dependent protease with chaperone function n=1 Tax=Psychrobacter luti TaxID=198481 RepID=A0A839TEE9_9GAMM|nr:M48 family metalloprotease [Psychrobacter luti]MBB3105953.1 Zn-dependent protease with chaperone function [Psychrobacter luti]
MDFFGAQRTRTQRSLLLYGLFFLIVFAHIAVALGVMALLLTLFTGGIYHWVLILVAVWTIGSFVAGSFLEYRRLRAGGRAIAQRVGAVRLFIDHSQDAWEHSQGVAHQHKPIQKVRFSARHIAVRNERDFPPVYRRYYEIAQQLAIASGLRMPILYVLPDEQGINGFVAGRNSQDMVLVVTQGALDKLSDEALYGLIGHEYGHILHGDATFNLQLMVVLAGLQLLYDWSDSINNFGSGYKGSQKNYFDGSFINSAVNQSNPLPQRAIDSHARSTEAQTASFTTHSEWVAYWQTQSQSQQASAKSQSRWLQNNNRFDSQAPRNIWTWLIHGLSFSSMASAQLIKHSFNRERELLADATSVQLTRSPAIIETLKAIHQDALGSRLTGIADINGLSHFFFASSGADLGDVSWFATHPSLAERMSAINANAYHKFAVQVAKEKRLNQQKIKEIYEQRRLGDWGVITANSLSNAKQEKKMHQSSIFAAQSVSAIHKINTDKNNYSAEKNVNSNFNDVINERIVEKDAIEKEVIEKEVIEKEIAAFSTSEMQNELQGDNGLEFIIEEDVVIDGRLQVQAQDIGTQQLLKPWQAKPDSDLPSDTLIGIEDIQKLSLPQYVLNHSYHPLGAQALIESVLLCHQGCVLSITATYDLTDIWLGLANDGTSAAETDTSGNTQILPHTIDHKLLTAVANLDRRLDSALIALALKQLRQHDLSESAINEWRLKYEASHSNQDHQHYVQQKKCRMMLLRYQQGIIQLFENTLTADLSQKFADHIDSQGSIDNPKSAFNHLESTSSRSPSILALWQALQLQQLLPILSAVLNDTQVQSHICPQHLKSQYFQWQQVLQAGKDNIYAQLDPSGQVFNGLDVAARTMLVLLAYRLSKDDKGQMISAIDSSVYSAVLSYNSASVAHYLVDLRRHARLIDIDLAVVSEANLQWLLLTAQNLNSVQLLALIEVVPIFIASDSQLEASEANGDDNYRQRQQGGGQIDYNAHIQDGQADSVDKAGNDSMHHSYTYHTYRQWLSTLHTVMLHDTIVSQDEYECLTELSNHWLGVRQLF